MTLNQSCLAICLTSNHIYADSWSLLEYIWVPPLLFFLHVINGSGFRLWRCWNWKATRLQPCHLHRCHILWWTGVTSFYLLKWLWAYIFPHYSHKHTDVPPPPSGFWGSMISSCEKSPTSPVWGGHLFPELFKALLYRASWYWWIMPPCNYVTFNNRWVGGGGWGYGGGGCWCPFTNLARTAGMVIRSRWC